MSTPCSSFFPLLTPCPPTSALFPYTTLFRSGLRRQSGSARGALSSRARRGRPRGIRLPRRRIPPRGEALVARSEEHTSELQSLDHLVCRLLLEKKKLSDEYTLNDHLKTRSCS